jgi:hypothetical protein
MPNQRARQERLQTESRNLSEEEIMPAQYIITVFFCFCGLTVEWINIAWLLKRNQRHRSAVPFVPIVFYLGALLTALPVSLVLRSPIVPLLIGLLCMSILIGIKVIRISRP